MNNSNFVLEYGIRYATSVSYMNICSQMHHVHIVTLLDAFSLVDAEFAANGKNTAHSDQTTKLMLLINQISALGYHITILPQFLVML